jgi:hypothetical protein
MVALDNAPDHTSAFAIETSSGSRLVLATAAGAALAAAIGYVLGEDGTGWALASDWASRFALLVFVAAMIAEPAGRLIPSHATARLAEARTALLMGFIAAMIVSLGCVLAPWLLGGIALGAPTVVYCVMSAMILTVLLFAIHPGTVRLIGAPSWRALQSVAAAYFWSVFALSAMGRVIGPHRPDMWPGFALLLLTAAVLLRFADAFLLHWRVAKKAG